MLLPINVDVPMDRWPIMNWVLIGATVLITLVSWCDPKIQDRLIGIDSQKPNSHQIPIIFEQGKATPQYPGFNPTPLELPVLAITSSFTHLDLFH